jgi:hypothetical protein
MCLTPLPAERRRMICTASGEKKRPSPPTTSVLPSGPPGMAERMDWTKFSV